MKKTYQSPDILIVSQPMSIMLCVSGRVNSNIDVSGGDRGADASMAL